MSDTVGRYSAQRCDHLGAVLVSFPISVTITPNPSVLLDNAPAGTIVGTIYVQTSDTIIVSGTPTWLQAPDLAGVQFFEIGSPQQYCTWVGDVAFTESWRELRQAYKHTRSVTFTVTDIPPSGLPAEATANGQLYVDQSVITVGTQH